MSRKAIAMKLRLKLMYDSQYLCAVCQQRGSHIHHIDKDNSNNQEDNLVVLCTNHHDDAHTKRELSQNLTPSALRDAKRKWLTSVDEQRSLTATMAGQLSLTGNNSLSSIGITWGYINHRRVGQLAKPALLDLNAKSYFHYCVAKGIIDRRGILIKPARAKSANSYIQNAVYDWYEHGDDQRLHSIYTTFVDQISRSVRPIHLERESWTKNRIKSLVRAGDFVFLNRAFYFKGLKETRTNQQRQVYTFKQKIRVEFFVDTINMFGTTSMTVSFSGRKVCAALVQVKSMEEKKGTLVLYCTPIALGVGFGKNWSWPAANPLS
jgi:hypothetical protein